MNKLIHERLMEYASEGTSCEELLKITSGEQCEYPRSCHICRRKIAKSIAEEIDRDYIPLPRFEDGEPVHFGESEISWIAEGNEHDAKGPFFFSSIGDEGTPVANTPTRIVARAEMTAEGRVKRSTPKVVDVNGIQINAGDIVYVVDSLLQRGHSFVVFDVIDSGNVRVKSHGSDHCPCDSYAGKSLSHESVIFSADGFPINVGDTVFNKKAEEYVVIGIRSEKHIDCECTHDGKNWRSSLDSQEVYHSEPDTIDKLLSDMREYATANGWYADVRIKSWTKRLAALVERGE